MIKTQLSHSDRQAIDKAIHECLGFIPPDINDVDRMDFLEDEDCIMENAIRYGFTWND